jgi:ArsR family transcriptional regulator
MKGKPQPGAQGSGPQRPSGQGRQADAELAGLAKALGHPARVRIVRVLARRHACVCGEIVGEMDLAQSTVSQHLKVLKEAGILQGEVEGPRTCYCLDPRALRRLGSLLASLHPSASETSIEGRRP